jgi:hypothetical protein
MSTEQKTPINKIETHENGDKSFTLPSGTKAVVKKFKGAHVLEAQKIVGTETEKYLPALIAVTTEFDGKSKVMEDVIEMDGWDFLKLMTVFSGDGSNF